MKERRLKRIMVHQGLILNLINKPKYFEEAGIWCTNNYYLKDLPEDAEVVGVTYDVNHACWVMFVTSEQFDIIPEREIVPIIEWNNEVLEKVDRYRKIEPYKPML
jgi:hypothetical protein